MNAEKRLTIKTDAASVLAEIRRSLSVMISQIPGDVRRPTTLQRTLGVDYKLCWQIFNIMRSDDPLSISQYVPGAAPAKKLIAAVRAQGVSEQVLTDVDNAMKEFRIVVATHSIDRRGFDSMVASISGGDAAESLALQHRRDAFRSESQVWGMQVETYLQQMIIKKTADGKGRDKCFINAKYGIRCLRQDVMPIVHGYRETSDTLTPDLVEPLDKAAMLQYGAPLLVDFSTQPVPRFKTFQNTDGWIYSGLDTDQIGLQSTVNMVFSGTARNLKMEHDENGSPTLFCAASVIVPTQLQIVEMFVHRESFGEVSPEFRVHASGPGVAVPEIVRLSQQFRINEELTALGPANNVRASLDVPSYSLQLKYVFDRLGWDPAEFDVFRVRIPYPVLHTRARISCKIADF